MEGCLSTPPSLFTILNEETASFVTPYVQISHSVGFSWLVAQGARSVVAVVVAHCGIMSCVARKEGTMTMKMMMMSVDEKTKTNDEKTADEKVGMRYEPNEEVLGRS